MDNFPNDKICIATYVHNLICLIISHLGKLCDVQLMLLHGVGSTVIAHLIQFILYITISSCILDTYTRILILVHTHGTDKQWFLSIMESKLIIDGLGAFSAAWTASAIVSQIAISFLQGVLHQVSAEGVPGAQKVVTDLNRMLITGVEGESGRRLLLERRHV